MGARPWRALGRPGWRHPLGGISDFKRHFTEHVAQVGAEWSFEPRRGRASAARAVSTTSTMVARAVAFVSGVLHHFSDVFHDVSSAIIELV